jgi:hypothetical protein
MRGAPAETTEGEREGSAKPKREAWGGMRDGEIEDGPMGGEGSAKKDEEAGKRPMGGEENSEG